MRSGASDGGFEITLNGVSEGQEAGIMSAEVTISGRYAYGADERGARGPIA